MDNEKIALSDVERNKELFEYEMTEVILQLKGKFAKVSGEDFDNEKMKLQAPEVNINIDFPELEVNSVAIESQEIADISKMNIEIPTSEVGKIDVDVPDVVKVDVKSLEKLNTEELHHNVPNTDIHVSTKIEKIDKANFGKLTVSPVDTTIKIPNVKFEQKKDLDLSDVNIPDTNIKISKVNLSDLDGISMEMKDISVVNSDVNIKGMQLNQKMDVDLSGVKVPDTNLNIHVVKNDLLDNVEIQTEIPNTEIKLQDMKEEISLDESKLSVDISRVPGKMLPNFTTSDKVEVGKLDVDFVDTTMNIRKKNIKCSVTSDFSINYPEIEGIHPKVYSYESIDKELNSVDVSVPEVGKVNLDFPSNILVDDKEMIISKDIEVPSVDLVVPAISVDDVKPVNLDVDYPKVKKTSIPKVSVGELKSITLPELPDYEDQVREIIDSIA